MPDNFQDLKATEIREVTVEEYHLDGQHFTRTLRIPRGGRSCEEVFAIDGERVRDSQSWLEAVSSARRQI